ncbi:hypothetical protein PAL_GLEAN10018355 [Pteropus alecto]|uniref:Uncharacterized protein n=1 Tax=Pteropus alecto TaxID=9402 RepID=L5JNJ8_PTEAL|nr:hypothetical protein PAL_GLEAN10018355 [Pteropus alecto]
MSPDLQAIPPSPASNQRNVLLELLNDGNSQQWLRKRYTCLVIKDFLLAWNTDGHPQAPPHPGSCCQALGGRRVSEDPRAAHGAAEQRVAAECVADVLAMSVPTVPKEEGAS